MNEQSKKQALVRKPLIDVIPYTSTQDVQKNHYGHYFALFNNYLEAIVSYEYRIRLDVLKQKIQQNQKDTATMKLVVKEVKNLQHRYVWKETFLPMLMQPESKWSYGPFKKQVLDKAYNDEFEKTRKEIEAYINDNWKFAHTLGAGVRKPLDQALQENVKRFQYLLGKKEYLSANDILEGNQLLGQLQKLSEISLETLLFEKAQILEFEKDCLKNDPWRQFLRFVHERIVSGTFDVEFDTLDWESLIAVADMLESNTVIPAQSISQDKGFEVDPFEEERKKVKTLKERVATSLLKRIQCFEQHRHTDLVYQFMKESFDIFKERNHDQYSEKVFEKFQIPLHPILETVGLTTTEHPMLRNPIFGGLSFSIVVDERMQNTSAIPKYNSEAGKVLGKDQDILEYAFRYIDKNGSQQIKAQATDLEKRKASIRAKKVEHVPSMPVSEGAQIYSQGVQSLPATSQILLTGNMQSDLCEKTLDFYSNNSNWDKHPKSKAAADKFMESMNDKLTELNAHLGLIAVYRAGQEVSDSHYAGQIVAIQKSMNIIFEEMQRAEVSKPFIGLTRKPYKKMLEHYWDELNQKLVHIDKKAQKLINDLLLGEKNKFEEIIKRGELSGKEFHYLIDFIGGSCPKGYLLNVFTHLPDLIAQGLLSSRGKNNDQKIQNYQDYFRILGEKVLAHLKPKISASLLNGFINALEMLKSTASRSNKVNNFHRLLTSTLGSLGFSLEEARGIGQKYAQYVMQDYDVVDDIDGSQAKSLDISHVDVLKRQAIVEITTFVAQMFNLTARPITSFADHMGGFQIQGRAPTSIKDFLGKYVTFLFHNGGSDAQAALANIESKIRDYLIRYKKSEIDLVLEYMPLFASFSHLYRGNDELKDFDKTLIERLFKSAVEASDSEKYITSLDVFQGRFVDLIDRQLQAFVNHSQLLNDKTKIENLSRLVHRYGNDDQKGLADFLKLRLFLEAGNENIPDRLKPAQDKLNELFSEFFAQLKSENKECPKHFESAVEKYGSNAQKNTLRHIKLMHKLSKNDKEYFSKLDFGNYFIGSAQDIEDAKNTLNSELIIYLARHAWSGSIHMLVAGKKCGNVYAQQAEKLAWFKAFISVPKHPEILETQNAGFVSKYLSELNNLFDSFSSAIQFFGKTDEVPTLLEIFFDSQLYMDASEDQFALACSLLENLSHEYKIDIELFSFARGKQISEMDRKITPEQDDNRKRRMIAIRDLAIHKLKLTQKAEMPIQVQVSVSPINIEMQAGSNGKLELPKEKQTQAIKDTAELVEAKGSSVAISNLSEFLTVCGTDLQKPLSFLSWVSVQPDKHTWYGRFLEQAKSIKADPAVVAHILSLMSMPTLYNPNSAEYSVFAKEHINHLRAYHLCGSAYKSAELELIKFLMGDNEGKDPIKVHSEGIGEIKMTYINNNYFKILDFAIKNKRKTFLDTLLKLGNTDLKKVVVYYLYTKLLKILTDDSKWSKNANLISEMVECFGSKETFIDAVNLLSANLPSQDYQALQKGFMGRHDALVQLYQKARSNQLLAKDVKFPLKERESVSSQCWELMGILNRSLAINLDDSSIYYRALHGLRKLTSMQGITKDKKEMYERWFSNSLAIVIGRSKSSDIEECEIYLKGLYFKRALLNRVEPRDDLNVAFCTSMIRELSQRLGKQEEGESAIPAEYKPSYDILIASSLFDNLLHEATNFIGKAIVFYDAAINSNLDTENEETLGLTSKDIRKSFYLLQQYMLENQIYFVNQIDTEVIKNNPGVLKAYSILINLVNINEDNLAIKAGALGLINQLEAGVALRQHDAVAAHVLADYLMSLDQNSLVNFVDEAMRRISGEKNKALALIKALPAGEKTSLIQRLRSVAQQLENNVMAKGISVFDNSISALANLKMAIRGLNEDDANFEVLVAEQEVAWTQSLSELETSLLIIEQTGKMENKHKESIDKNINLLSSAWSYYQLRMLELLIAKRKVITNMLNSFFAGGGPLNKLIKGKFKAEYEQEGDKVSLCRYYLLNVFKPSRVGRDWKDAYEISDDNKTKKAEHVSCVNGALEVVFERYKFDKKSDNLNDKQRDVIRALAKIWRISDQAKGKYLQELMSSLINTGIFKANPSLFQLSYRYIQLEDLESFKLLFPAGFDFAKVQPTQTQLDAIELFGKYYHSTDDMFVKMQAQRLFDENGSLRALYNVVKSNYQTQFNKIVLKFEGNSQPQAGNIFTQSLVELFADLAELKKIPFITKEVESYEKTNTYKSVLKAVEETQTLSSAGKRPQSLIASRATTQKIQSSSTSIALNKDVISGVDDDKFVVGTFRPGAVTPIKK